VGIGVRMVEVAEVAEAAEVVEVVAEVAEGKGEHSGATHVMSSCETTRTCHVREVGGGEG
jgi:hypothetical protein